MFRAPSALLPSGTGHVLGFSTTQRNCLQLVFRGQGASSGHIKNYEMRCAPSSRTLNCNIFSVAITKGFHYAFSLPALGTGTREVCIFLWFSFCTHKTWEQMFSTWWGNWTSESTSGKRRFSLHKPFLGLPSRLRGKEPALQCTRRGFEPWVRKIPWRRKRLPTPVFLPGKAHGQRSLAGHRLRVTKESTQPSNQTTMTNLC